MEGPAYKIRYFECKVKGHQGEKVNLICLAKQCSEQSLICSLCATAEHFGHRYKPIKIYLDQLYKQYIPNQRRYGQQMEQLQNRKTILLLRLKDCVERVAEQFMKLEEDIINNYERVKHHIKDNEAKRSQFQSFYLSMITDNFGDPHFQIKNYLFSENVPSLPQQNIFSDLTQKIVKQISYLKDNLIVKGQQKLPSIFSSSTVHINNQISNSKTFFKPLNIIQDLNVFTQTNLSPNAQGLCLFDLQTTYWNGKIRIQILKYANPCKITLGLVERLDFQKQNFSFNNAMKSVWIDSLGLNKGAQYNHIPSFSSTTTLDCYIKKGNFRIMNKNNNAMFNVYSKTLCLFFVLEGNTSIRVTYPYTK